jgi:hypothetical protein
MKKKRLTLDIPELFHSEIKAQAAWRNTTIRKYVIAAIAEKMKKDKACQ